MAIPLIYLSARAAFAAIDREMEDNARVMGANRLQVFWHVSLPLALRGLASGLMLGFARALGEFGATLMVFGIQKRMNDDGLIPAGRRCRFRFIWITKTARWRGRSQRWRFCACSR